MKKALKVQDLDPISNWASLRLVLHFCVVSPHPYPRVLYSSVFVVQDSHLSEDLRVKDGQLDNGRGPAPKEGSVQLGGRMLEP